MYQIVIPMAGAGSRFSRAGFTIPKPLIPVHGIPMIQLVIENIRPSFPHRYIFICQKNHILSYSLDTFLQSLAPGCIIVDIDGLTEGAVCTILHAKKYIDTDSPIMIANSDQFIEYDINAYLEYALSSEIDGCIMTMKSRDPKWSFVTLNSLGYVSHVAEKKVISDVATVGIYNFSSGKIFVNAAEMMIAQNIRVNNEFYVAPVYNQLISVGKKIGSYSIGSDTKGMHGLGTPEDLELFINNPLSHTVTEVLL